jgi:hypothetical protein
MTADLPENFRPARVVKVGTNRFENTTALFSWDGKFPLLIGQNSDRPNVHCWMSAPSKSGWFDLVLDNEPQIGLVEVKAQPRTIVIRVPESTVFSAIVGVAGVVVSKLDLRPLGLNVYLEDSVLVAGSSRLSNNLFRNLKAGIHLTGEL